MHAADHVSNLSAPHACIAYLPGMPEAGENDNQVPILHSFELWSFFISFSCMMDSN